ncbi:Thioredoxin domain-containing protein 3 -like protein [Trametes pubescens]|uniref:Nucleoside diphosphate kinase n=1 Tax=Trametes pubescens TaxID=154538 RepID=A0A1M2W659_TRAPU|nr:Thioredoxin domain-containing protein 3 -like protein [Trametes pubescens]
MSAPSSPQQAPGEIEIVSSPVSPPTRTVAIIKHHALNHRFDIELRISDAGFEIVKERQMEFDVETDPDTLFELFGPDFESFAEGPVWVYVLERRRAVEVWHSLMGDPDPEVARKDTPNSIRALYGLSAAQNAVMGSTDAQIAEMQIQAIFASSPPFPTTELPDVGHTDYDNVPAGSLRSVSSSVLSALRNGRSDNGYPASSTAGTSTNGLGKPAFKARNLPATHAAPDIVPRMSKAAALRAGISYESPKRAPPTKERLAQTFANVPGHKRSETISVASTAPPAFAPRMTRAASLRLGIKPEEKPRRPVTANSDASGNAKDPKHTFDGVPGHKRRESIAVASTRPPAVAPRTNRSAALRQQKDAAPPSSFACKRDYSFRAYSLLTSLSRTPVRQPSQTGPSRSSSRQSFSGTSSARPTFSRPPSAASTAAGPAPARLALSRTTSLTSAAKPAPRPSAAFASKTAPTVPRARPTPAPKEEPVAPAKPRPRPSSLQAPTVAPRTNKSALLRAAKMASAALGATPAKKPAPVPRAVRA